MTMHRLHGAVSDLMVEVGHSIIMPRFQTLATHEISEKSPGEIVTIADEESEERISEQLARILPEARIVGEEATAADASLLDTLGAGLSWLVDPVDGTTNFSEGKTPFAIMIALLEDGEAQAGWIYDPVTQRMCHAHHGHGAFVGDERIRTEPTNGPMPIAALGMHFLPAERRDMLEERASGKLDIVAIPRCAGEQYPRLALGVNEISLYERVLPWDHAPGALFLSEAGGKTARPDGTPFSPTDQRPGLLSAATPQLWEQAAEILFA